MPSVRRYFVVTSNPDTDVFVARETSAPQSEEHHVVLEVQCSLGWCVVSVYGGDLLPILSSTAPLSVAIASYCRALRSEDGSRPIGPTDHASVLTRPSSRVRPPAPGGSLTVTDCSVVGCGRSVLARGLCVTHYKRLRRRGFVGGSGPERVRATVHSCGRGHEACVSPNHLSWKTPKENEADKMRHGTRRSGTIR